MKRIFGLFAFLCCMICFAPRALAEMQAAMREHPSNYLRELIKGFSERHGLQP